MAIFRNKQSIMGAFSGFDVTLRTLLVDRPKAYALSLREKLKNLPLTNFELGCDFAERGQWKDAAFRFRVAIYLEPGFTQAHYNLGCCQLRLGQRAAARNSFLTVLKQAPHHTDATFMLSAVDPGAVPLDRRPQRMPMVMVQQFFSGMAPRYDAVEANNNYQGARLVYDVVKPLLAKTQDITLIDLGSGTGIASRPWRPIAREMIAVDAVPAMAAEARQVKLADAPLFERVLEADILDAAEAGIPFSVADVILCVNTAQFLGNLQPLLAALGERMKPGALLALTIEPFAASAGFGVNIDTGRFGHHPDYVKLTARNAGLDVKHESRVQLYPGFSAQLFVLGK